MVSCDNIRGIAVEVPVKIGDIFASFSEQLRYSFARRVYVKRVCFQCMLGENIYLYTISRGLLAYSLSHLGS
ncbi:MAG TPA: hypothetical protein K8V05_13905, partial [Butyricimonas virosa]|nr:hypothetical protein [Butyricimonas virosa]